MAVVIPCYNYGRYLDACVASVLTQPGVTTQVHIIDDASTDGSPEIAEAIAGHDPRVRLTCHQQNRGHIATYNEGLSAVDSDYVVLLSADDMLAPGALARAVALMEKFPSVGLVYGHPQAFETPPRQNDDRPRNWSVWQGQRWIRAQFRRGLGIISSPEAVVRTSVQHRVGYYRPELPHSGDLEMWLRIADISDVGRVNGVDQAYRRLHNASMMTTGYGTLLRDLEERVKAYESFLAVSRLPAPRIDSLRSTVNRRMAMEALEWSASNCARGNVSEEDIKGALAFARSVFPAADSSIAYHDYIRQRGSATSLSVSGRLAAWRGSINREFGPRIRWQRWRRYGI
ncbi:glycosyltransferase family A protein [Arthrobacter sp. NPDC080031]|uniref:glycosyltransferase family 2 protein n=1 Tax=Arthrobacter sp. NPDC080031 TaxID=3155918 RepID=UPI00344FF7F8